MDVEASEAQMPGGGRTPVMACMPCECRLRSTGDATESFCQFGFAANVIYGALRQVNPVFQRLNRGFPLAPRRRVLSQRRAEGIAPYVARLRELFWSVLCRRRWRTGTSKRSAPRVSGETTGGILCLRTYGAVI